MKVIYLKQCRAVKAVRARESEICEREDSLRVALNIYLQMPLGAFADLGHRLKVKNMMWAQQTRVFCSHAGMVSPEIRKVAGLSLMYPFRYLLKQDCAGQKPRCQNLRKAQWNMLQSPVHRMRRLSRRGHGQQLKGPKEVVNLHWLYAITISLGPFIDQYIIGKTENPGRPLLGSEKPKELLVFVWY